MIDSGPTARSKAFWRREARSLARRVNIGWWLERFNIFLVVGLVLFATVILLLRTLGHAFLETGLPWIGLAAFVVVAALVSWIWIRGRFIGEQEGLVRLDDRLGLRSRLASADSGVGNWPDEKTTGGAAPSWRWPVILVPGFLAGVLVMTAWFIPLPEVSAKETLVTNEPDSWDQMEDWLEVLEDEEIIEPDSLEEIEEKIEELRDQPEEEWFSHASLEASDTLKDSLARDIREMASDMAALERDLESLRSYSTEMSEEGREMLLQEFDEAMKGLQTNGMELNEELAKQLSQVDPSQIGQKQMSELSQKQLESLQEKLGQCSQALGSMEGLPQLSEDQTMSFRPGMTPGRGDIQRGRGDAPLFFGDADDLKTNQLESVENDDLSQAALGDLLGIGETEHEDEKPGSQAQQGGAISSQGRGGDAVWKDSLVPQEKALLKRYFK